MWRRLWSCSRLGFWVPSLRGWRWLILGSQVLKRLRLWRHRGGSVRRRTSLRRSSRQERVLLDLAQMWTSLCLGLCLWPLAFCKATHGDERLPFWPYGGWIGEAAPTYQRAQYILIQPFKYFGIFKIWWIVVMWHKMFKGWWLQGCYILNYVWRRSMYVSFFLQIEFLAFLKISFHLRQASGYLSGGYPLDK